MAEEITAPQPLTFGEFRKGTKLYPAESVDTIIEKTESAAIIRENAINTTIEQYKTEVAGQMTAQTQAMEDAVAAAKSELRTEIENKAGEGGIHYMGVLATRAELDALTGMLHGQFYIVNDVNKTFIWTQPPAAEGEEAAPGFWKEMSASVDLSNYVTKDLIYSKEEIDLIRERANANEQKLTAIATACTAFKDILPLQDEEYTVDEMAGIVNKMLSVMQVLAGFAK